MKSEENYSLDRGDIFEEMFSRADKALVSIAESISENYELQESAFKLEQSRLAAKYGSDSQQAKMIQSRLDLLSRQRSEIKLQLGRFSVATPKTSADTFVVYGRIINQDGDGISGLKVSVINKKLETVGHDTTDENGLFNVSLPVADDLSAQLGLRVADKNEKTVWKDKGNFSPTPGRVLYREVVASAEPVRRTAKKANAKRRLKAQ
ncbi:MAG: carboxypeptidase-like regulatory domain-containing protein [Blastocatellia bacterium]